MAETITLVAIPGHGCNGCIFKDIPSCRAVLSDTFACVDPFRQDKTSVIWIIKPADDK